MTNTLRRCVLALIWELFFWRKSGFSLAGISTSRVFKPQAFVIASVYASFPIFIFIFIKESARDSDAAAVRHMNNRLYRASRALTRIPRWMAGNPGCGSLTRSPLSRAWLRRGVIKALRLPVKRTSNYLFIYTIKACSAHLHAGVSVLIRCMNSRDALPISLRAMRRSHARARLLSRIVRQMLAPPG